MNKLLALIPVVFAIFALMVSPAIMDVSATKEDNNGQHKGKPQNCDNGKGQDNVQNPNCDDITEPPTGVNCTYSDDGNITSLELATALGINEDALAKPWIATAESDAKTKTPDGIINSDQELRHLNHILEDNERDLCY